MEAFQLVKPDKTFHQNIYYIGLFVIEIYHQEFTNSSTVPISLGLHW